MPGHHPIADPLFIEGGELPTLRHKSWCSIDTADLDPVPTRYDAGICIKILVAAIACVQVAGSAITGYDLFDLGIFGTIIDDGDLGCIQTASVVPDSQHVITGCQVVKQGR